MKAEVRAGAFLEPFDVVDRDGQWIASCVSGADADRLVSWLADQPDPPESIEEAYAVVAGGATFHLPGEHDQRSHGRRGRQVPGAGTQTPNPNGRVAAHSAKWHRDLGDLGDLIAAEESGDVDTEELSGGQWGTTGKVTYANGKVGVAKVMHDNTTSGFGTAKDQADAEQLVSALGRALGLPVPRVLRMEEDEIVMDYVDGATGADLLQQLMDEHADATNPNDYPTVEEWESVVADMANEDFRGLQVALAMSDSGRRLGLLDLMTGNWDRVNATNWMVTEDGRMVGIDHSFAFMPDQTQDGQTGESTGSSAGTVFDMSPFAVSYVRVPPGAPTVWTPNGPRVQLEWDDNDLSPEDVAWLRAQLDDLRDDFEVLDREDWWQFASERLDAIAEHARGTESRFAP